MMMRGHWDPDEASRWLASDDERPIIRPAKIGVYHPRPNVFWYGTVCGFCLATSVAAFAAATHYLGVW